MGAFAEEAPAFAAFAAFTAQSLSPKGGIDPGGYPKILTHSSGVASRTLRFATPNRDATARRSTRSEPRSISSAGVTVRRSFSVLRTPSSAFASPEAGRSASGAPSAAATAAADRDPVPRRGRSGEPRNPAGDHHAYA